MPQTENHHCEICDSDDLQLISNKGRDYLETNTSICKQCGFVFLSPRMAHSDYIEFYSKTYDKLYRTNNFGEEYNEEKIAANPYGFEPVYQRIKPYVQQNNELRILGIGSGDGNNLKYLGNRLNTSQLFAIEPSEEGQKHIKTRGITLVSNDIMNKWVEKLEHKMDVIVLRHVFEHLPNLNKSLMKIHEALSSNGLVYMAVPNSYDVGNMSLLRDFFRIVHLSYFSMSSLRNILIKNKFEIIELKEFKGANSELYVIAKAVDYSSEIKCNKDEYKKQLDYFRPLIEKESKLLFTIRSLIKYLNRRYVILKSMRSK